MLTVNRILAIYLLKRLCERYPDLMQEVVQNPHDAQWIAYEALSKARKLTPTNLMDVQYHG